jgi:hypothetical protein
MPSKKRSAHVWDIDAACREQAAKSEASMVEFMKTFSNPEMKIVKVGEYASCMPGDGSDPNLRVPVVTMQGDKVVDFLDPDEPILIGQSTVDLQADLLHRNLGRADLVVKLAKAQKIVAAMTPGDPRRTEAARILAINLYAKYLRTRRKKYLDSAIQNGHVSMAAGSGDLYHLAAMHYRRYEITGQLDDLDEAISISTMAISKASENESLYSNIGGYCLQKYNHTKSVKDLKAAFSASAAAVANSIKRRSRRSLHDRSPFDNSDLHNRIHNLTFLIPIFLRHGIVLPTLNPWDGDVKAWKETMARMFDTDTTEYLLEVFDALRFKHGAAGLSAVPHEDQPRYLRTREAKLSDIFVSEIVGSNPSADRDDSNTGRISPANPENPSNSPHESTLLELENENVFNSHYFQMHFGGKMTSSSTPSKSMRFMRFENDDIPYSIPEHCSTPEDGTQLETSLTCGSHNGDNLTAHERYHTTLFWHHESHILLIPGRDAEEFYPFPSSLMRSRNSGGGVKTNENNARDEKSAAATSLPLDLSNPSALRMPEAGDTTRPFPNPQHARLSMSKPYEAYRAEDKNQNHPTVPFPPPPESLLPGITFETNAFNSAVLGRMASNTRQLYLGSRVTIRQELEGVALGDDYLPLMDTAPRTAFKKNSRLCDICRMIDFKSLFRGEKPPRTWLVTPPPRLASRYETCKFCRFLCGVAIQHQIPLQQDGSYVPVAITPASCVESSQDENKNDQQARCFIIPMSNCDVPCIEARLVAPKYNSASPLMARLPLRHVIDVSLVKYWLKYCETRHKDICGALPWRSRDGVPPSLRVIDVRTYTLVDAPPGCRYCALSYVWGPAGSNVFKTTSKNKDKVGQPGGLRDLSEKISKTVLDAIRLVEEIGEEYLWVDALCIIQDDKRDIDAQIERMNDIYASAVLTIVAAGGADSNAGLPGVYPQLRQLPQVTEEVDDVVRLALPLEPSRKLRDSAWNSRAWTFQEEMLSARTLIFIDDQVFWKCRCCTWFEDVVSEVEETPEGSPAPRTNLSRDNFIMELHDIREIKALQQPRGREEPPFSLEEYGSTGARYEPAITLDDAMDPGEEVMRATLAEDNVARYTIHRTFDDDLENIVKLEASVAPVRYTIGKHYRFDHEGEVEEFFSPDPRLKDAITCYGADHASLLSWNFREYTKVVLQYTQRLLSYPSDIGRAFAGIQNALESCLTLPFVHGLPTSHFDAALLWMPVRSLTRRVVEDDKSPPSWSWMGWCGPVQYTMVDAKVNRPEVRVHPLVRWHHADGGSGGFELLNGYGIGMATACHPAGRLVKSWKDNRWSKDCLYKCAESPESESNIVVPEPVSAVDGLLRFHTLSASFRIGDSDSVGGDTSCLIIEESLRTMEYDHDRLFIRSMRPEGKCCRIIDHVGRSAGYMVWNEKGPEKCATSEMIILAATAGRRDLSSGYSGYAVMAVEWEDGVAYRTGLGEVDQEALWDANPCWKEVILG